MAKKHGFAKRPVVEHRPCFGLRSMKEDTLDKHQGDESPACPTCGREDFASVRGMKTHHARAHGESLNNEYNSTMTATEDKPWRDGDLLSRLYCEEEMTMEQIAEKLGCSIGVISRWVGYHGIEARPRSGSGWDNPRMKPYARFVTTPEGKEKWEDNFEGERDTLYIHRLVAVAEYGFDAVAGNVVHHKNHIPWDNRPENLEPVSWEEHSRQHQNERVRRELPTEG